MASRFKQNGYWLIKWYENGIRFHKFEHRIIWEQANGPIPDGYYIHHINEIRDDNRLENMQLVTRGEHNAIHHKKHENALAKSRAWRANNLDHARAQDRAKAARLRAKRTPEQIQARLEYDRARYWRLKEQRANV